MFFKESFRYFMIFINLKNRDVSVFKINCFNRTFVATQSKSFKNKLYKKLRLVIGPIGNINVP